MDFAAYPHVKFVTVAKGDCWIQVGDGSDALHVVDGDCYLLTRGDAYRIGSSLAMLPLAIDCGEYFRHHRSQDGVVRYGARADLLAIGGHFTLADDNSALLLDLLSSSFIFAPPRRQRRLCAACLHYWYKRCRTQSRVLVS